MNDLLGGAVALVVAILVGIWMALLARRRVQRARSLPAVATSSGLAYSEVDPLNTTAPPFPLFRAGDGRLVEHVMWRTDVEGLPRVFDYSYFVRDREGSERWSRYTCALVRHDGRWPPLAVLRERVLDRAARVLGGQDVEMESEEFNRTFVVRCENPKFATDFLSPEVMALLLETAGHLEVESRGRFLLVTSDPLDPPSFPGLLGFAQRLLATLPPVLDELYGRFPPGLGTEEMPSPAEPSPRSGAGAKILPTLLPGDRPSFEFAPAPRLRGDGDDPWDPTPGVDHDLEGRAVEPTDEDPWGEGRKPPGRSRRWT